jgi:hypothetical protein
MGVALAEVAVSRLFFVETVPRRTRGAPPLSSLTETARPLGPSDGRTHRPTMQRSHPLSKWLQDAALPPRFGLTFHAIDGKLRLFLRAMVILGSFSIAGRGGRSGSVRLVGEVRLVGPWQFKCNG